MRIVLTCTRLSEYEMRFHGTKHKQHYILHDLYITPIQNKEEDSNNKLNIVATTMQHQPHSSGNIVSPSGSNGSSHPNISCIAAAATTATASPATNAFATPAAATAARGAEEPPKCQQLPQ
jgi:xylose isomerase